MKKFSEWLYRGIGYIKPADPGDFGIGLYYSSNKSRAKQYGNRILHVEVGLDNPLYLSVEKAYDLADKYGTIRGNLPIGYGIGKREDRELAAKWMTRDLQKKGYDGIVVTEKDGELEVVVFPGG